MVRAFDCPFCVQAGLLKVATPNSNWIADRTKSLVGAKQHRPLRRRA
jgi:hypothetical protein